MNRCVVVIEPPDGNLSVYVPELLDHIATGVTEADIRSNNAEATRMHLESLRTHGEPVSPPTSTTATIDV